MRFTKEGRLGIGQTNPSYKLDVAGTARFTGDITGNLVGNVTGTILTAAQPNITSVGTLTTLDVDNIKINNNVISSTANNLKLTPLSGKKIVLDGTIFIDAGVVTGATSITSTSFVGALTGNASTATTAGTVTTAAQPNITSVGTLGNTTMSGYIERDSHVGGFLCGSFNSVENNNSKSNPIYVIGSNYIPLETTISGMYGIGYTKHNASFITGTGSGWGMYIAADGVANVFFGASADSTSYINTTGKFGLGTDSPTEKLTVNGAIKIGNADATGNGTIRWTGSDFEGRKAGSWVSLTSTGGGSVPDDLGVHSLVVGQSHSTADSGYELHVVGGGNGGDAGGDHVKCLFEDRDGNNQIIQVFKSATATREATIGLHAGEQAFKIKYGVGDTFGSDNTSQINVTATGVGIFKMAPTVPLEVVGASKLGGNVEITGNLTVAGTTTTVNTTDIVVEDSLIQLASTNAADTADIGMYGKYVSGGTTYYTGLVRDASASGWHLFTSQSAPSTAGVSNLSYSPLRTEALTCTTINASGNITGTLATAAQTNITSVGSLTSLDTTGSIKLNNAQSNLILRTNSNDTDDTNSILFQNSGNAYSWRIARRYNTTYGNTSADASLVFSGGDAVTNGYTNLVDRVCFHQNGNVGIGTLNPTAKIDIKGNGDLLKFETDRQWKFHTNGTSGASTQLHLSSLVDSKQFIIDLNGGLRMASFYARDTAADIRVYLCEAGGRVGIGNTAPAYNLDVSGTGRFTDNLIAGQSGEEMRIGYTGFSNWAGIMNNSSPMYALMQDGNGKTLINSANGQKMDFRINNSNKMTISGNNVGIGTSSPEEKLDVNGTLYLRGGTSSSIMSNVEATNKTNTYISFGANGTSSDGASLRQIGGNNGMHMVLDFYDDGDDAGFSIRDVKSTTATDTITTRFIVERGGNVGIGTNNPRNKLHLRGWQFYQSTSQNANYGWKIGTGGSGNDAENFDFYRVVNNSETRWAYIEDDNSAVHKLDFTGQHRNKMKENNDEYIENINKYVGLIVCASGEFIKKIQINEALPLVELSNESKQKTAFGVISDGEDKNSNYREYKQGNFVSVIQKEENDERVIINSLGEGGVWVCDVNGPIENGDYITTTELAPGYGVKQDDDLLHNYTVAKITQNEDFSDMTDPEFSRILENGVKCKFVGCTYHCG
jgi:hypothetical protein